MNSLLIAIAVIQLLLIIGVVIYLLSRQTSPSKEAASPQLEQMIQQQNQQFQNTVNLVMQQLNHQQESSQRTTQMVHSSLTEVHGRLVKMEEANNRIYEVGKDISGLQAILQAPKLRGTLGEVWLQEIIAQMVPKEHYKMQYRFKNGETCDAVINLRDDMILPIDSKFSLENFVKMNAADNPDKEAHKKAFISDTKKRIDEIAAKYIQPHEGTLDCAFMYVPAENVYYQAFIQNDDTVGLSQYAFNKKVVPVSPNSFYAYVQVVMFGLRGMEVEKNIKVVQKNLVGLNEQFNKFRVDYDKIGTHLRNASGSYDSGDKHLGKIEGKFDQIANTEELLIEEGSND